MSVSAKQPLVSVCIPVYNDQAFIKYAIESVLKQTYQNWELVIIENRSTDGTFDVIKQYTDPRIKVIQNKEHLAICDNWNAALKNASGEYVKLLHSDDLISPGCLEQQVEIFESGKYPTIALVTSFRNVINSSGDFIMVRKFPFSQGLIPAQKAISMNFLFATNIIGELVIGLFRKSVFDQVGYFDDSNVHVADVDFWVRILLTGDLYEIPEPLGSFRISKKTTTFKTREQHTRMFRQFAKKIYKDKRFHIGPVLYSIAYLNTYLVQRIMRRVFLFFFIKD